MLREGDAAPDFVLKDADGEDVRLSSFSGKPIVLYFYPKDNTPGCNIQARGLRDSYEEIAGHGAVVVGVSMDDVQTHCGFRDDNDIPFMLLADPDGRVHDLYEAWRTSLLGRSRLAVRRCTFIIDSRGVIARVYPNVNVLRHARQVIRDLERLKAQDEWGQHQKAPKVEPWADEAPVRKPRAKLLRKSRK